MHIFFYLLLFIQKSLGFILLRVLRLKKALDRVDFECANDDDPYEKSFKSQDLSAKVTIHLSSEGEYSQIAFLIKELLSKGELVEIIYTSPSVMNTMESLKKQYSSSILRIVKLPLLSSLELKMWSSSSTLVMIRYDFFPELMLLGLSKEKFILYSASLKSSSGLSKLIKVLMLKSFTHYIAATRSDFHHLKEVLSNKEDINILREVDLRSLEINQRQVSPDFTKLQIINVLKEKVLPFHEDQSKFLFSQVWKKEFTLIKNFLMTQNPSSWPLVYIAPHDLSPDNQNDFEDMIREHINVPLYVLHKHFDIDEVTDVLKDYKDNKGVILCMIPGLLCELYPYFSKAYIGGGFGKGIHSVLEPFMGGCQMIVGPNVKRSTEYDTIVDLGGAIKTIDTQEEFSFDFFKDENERELKLDISNYIRHNEKALNDFKKLL